MGFGAIEAWEKLWGWGSRQHCAFSSACHGHVWQVMYSPHAVGSNEWSACIILWALSKNVEQKSWNCVWSWSDSQTLRIWCYVMRLRNTIRKSKIWERSLGTCVWKARLRNKTLAKEALYNSDPQSDPTSIVFSCFYCSKPITSSTFLKTQNRLIWYFMFVVLFQTILN